MDEHSNKTIQNITNQSDSISTDSMQQDEFNTHVDSDEAFIREVTLIQKNMNDLLKEWGFNDELHEFLQSKNVTIHTLTYMKERHLDELFPPDLFSTKVIFEHKLFAWQNTLVSKVDTSTKSLNSSVIKWLEDHSKSVPCSCSTPSISAKENVRISRNKNASSTLHTLDDIKIEDILNNFEQGKLLLESYKNGQQLNPSDRTMLVHKIIQYFIEINFKLNVPKVKQLSEKIIDLFPTENQKTYFIGRGKLPPKGKLWDRYQCQLRNLKKLSAFKGTPRREKELDLGKGRNKKMEMCTSEDLLTEEELASIALSLKHIRQWDEVLLKWKQTVKYRRNYIDNSNDANLLTIIQKWPLYKFSRAPELVDIDFDYLKSEKELFFHKWDHFLKVATELFKTRVKDPVARHNLAEFLECRNRLTSDTVNFQNIHLLHAVLVPSSTVIKNKRRKFSISDSQNSFALIVENSGEVEDILFSKREFCLLNGTCLQPIIIVVGDRYNLKEFFVALDNIKYKFDSFLAAVEYCFKLFYVLNLEYPRECLLVWMFVQRYLFGITDEEQEVYPVLETFIGDINKFQILN